MSGWIGVDLDGTLAVYDKWRGVGFIGKPIPLMVERIKHWLKQGVEVRIFTARMANPEPEVMQYIIGNWLEREADLPRLTATNVKDYDMIALWDDRAVQVVPNTGERVGNHHNDTDPAC